MSSGRQQRSAEQITPGSLGLRAEAYSRAALENPSDRWAHSQAVAERAAFAAMAMRSDQREVLVAAAWLHDIGYAQGLKVTGFHPVDGARALRDAGWPPLVVALVAHHSGARFVAAVRGLGDELAPFDRPPEGRLGRLSDALTWADQTVDSLGRVVAVEDRLRDMLLRHGPDSPNARCHDLRGPYILGAVARTEALIRATLG